MKLMIDCVSCAGPEQDAVSRRGALQAAVSAAAALSLSNGFVTSGPAQAAGQSSLAVDMLRSSSAKILACQLHSMSSLRHIAGCGPDQSYLHAKSRILII